MRFSASDGLNHATASLNWVFGLGVTGQSYLFDFESGIYESRFSYFDGIEGFDFTPGRPHLESGTVKAALGRPLAEAEARGCFGCHSTGVSQGKHIDPKDLIPGVTCEACHGPGINHVVAMKSGLESATGLIFNPVNLRPGERNDFCGSCHRAFWDVELAGTRGVATALFQPYRMERSKCWSTTKGDQRLTCTACHDPHAPRSHEASYYDSRCLACHAKAGEAKAATGQIGKACPTGAKNCVTCHMPKYELPEMHYRFTDHKIRVAAKDGAFED
jgi:hypothetical protein